MVNTEFLSSISIFSTLDAPQLEYLAEHLMVLEKKDKDVVFKKDAPGNAMYFIQEGSVKITIPAVNGDELTLAVFQKGDFFGELTLFDNTSRTANAIVLGHATLLVMPRNDFITFMKVNPDVAIGMLAVLGKRLSETNEIMEMQTTRNVNDEMNSKLSTGDKITSAAAGLLGSWKFVIWLGVGLSFWVLLNFYAILFKPFDPYPFMFLNLVFSCLTAFQAVVILMNQGWANKKDKISADFDYQINLKSELQIQDIRMKLEKIDNFEQKLYHEVRRDQAELIEKQNRILEKLANIAGRKHI